VRKDVQSGCRAFLPLPRGERAGVRVKPRRGVDDCPLTQSLSREGRGDTVRKIVQNRCGAFPPLHQGRGDIVVGFVPPLGFAVLYCSAKEEDVKGDDHEDYVDGICA
jgi:hypothetical protein